VTKKRGSQASPAQFFFRKCLFDSAGRAVLCGGREVESEYCQPALEIRCYPLNVGSPSVVVRVG
jgi:hypothetical protein